MFRAIRDFFGKPENALPRRGRGRRLAALFVFEFVVVLLGVLAAQLLQDWFAQRASARRAAEAVVALYQEANSFAQLAEYRLRAHDCEVARIARLRELARTGASANDAERTAPIMPMPIVTAWSDETRSAVARHADAETIGRYDGLRLIAQMISERQRQLENQWADFRLLAPAAGPIAPENRIAIELATARAEGLLTMIDMNAASIAGYARDFKPDRQWLARIAALDHPCAKAALVPVVRR